MPYTVTTPTALNNNGVLVGQRSNLTVTTTEMATNQMLVGVTGGMPTPVNIGTAIAPFIPVSTSTSYVAPVRRHTFLVSSSAIVVPAASPLVLTFSTGSPVGGNDDGGQWSTATPTRLTAQAAGVYHIGGSVEWGLSSAIHWRQLYIRLNGSAVVGQIDSRQIDIALSNITETNSVSATVALSSGDYAELFVNTDGAGTQVVQRNIYYSPAFWMTQVSS